MCCIQPFFQLLRRVYVRVFSLPIPEELCFYILLFSRRNFVSRNTLLPVIWICTEINCCGMNVDNNVQLRCVSTIFLSLVFVLHFVFWIVQFFFFSLVYAFEQCNVVSFSGGMIIITLFVQVRWQQVLASRLVSLNLRSHAVQLQCQRNTFCRRRHYILHQNVCRFFTVVHPSA